MTQEELLNGLKEGYPEVYEEQFDRFLEPLCFFAKRYLHDRQDFDSDTDLRYNRINGYGSFVVANPR